MKSAYLNGQALPHSVKQTLSNEKACTEDERYASFKQGLISHGRPVNYLRISLTDRCNLRCVYCMSASGIKNKLCKSSILKLEEIADFVRIACNHGIKNVRLTGGEPLTRLGIADLVRQLSDISQLENLAMTTNGQLFSRYAEQLYDAGLSRVTFSMDSTNPETYRRLTRGGDVNKVIQAIELALKIGFAPVKINVLAYDLTAQDIQTFMEIAQTKPVSIRFIEYMPLGRLGREQRDAAMMSNLIQATGAGFVKSSFHQDTQSCRKAQNQSHSYSKCSLPQSLFTMHDVFETINALALNRGLGSLVPIDGLDAPIGFGPASLFTLESQISKSAKLRGSFGFIGVHSQDFCGQCNRIRLTADGKIRTCLFSDNEISVTDYLRNRDEKGVEGALLSAIDKKPLSYERQQGTRREMAAIGG